MEPIRVDSLDSLPEAIRPLFKQVGDGYEHQPEDVTGLKNKVSELLGENKKLKGRTADLEGLDPAEAKKAIARLKEIEKQDLEAAGKHKELLAQVVEESKAKMEAKDSEIAKLQGMLHKELISGKLASSQFVADNLIITPDIVEKMFGDRFRIEDGRPVGVDESGKIIMSDENLGQPAGIDEALGKFIDGYQHKDRILKSETRPGSGITPGSKTKGTGKTMSRAQFEKMSPADRVEFAKDGGQLT